ncbi:TetR/AcrR family transcriptional regulator [Rhodococcus erythropolis]|uniref:TetR/AcrR family transcriptional regulator n=1 Tax=Rhodococcus erythropolis TaxID=1833 RepID=UPI00381878E0
MSAPNRPSSGLAPSTARGRRTRAALIEASRDLFEERGFRETRIADIAERAKLAYGTFYHYFESKEVVLNELFTSVAGEMFNASQLRDSANGDAVAKIDAVNRQYFAVAERNAWLIAVIDEVAVRDDSFRQLKLQLRDLFLRRNEANIKKLQESGAVEATVNAKIAAAALGGMVEHFTQMWFIHGVTFDREDAIHTLTFLWAQALGIAVHDNSMNFLP